VDRITADSNIWVSGLNWRGKPHELLNLARRGQIELAVSDKIVDEVSRILRDKLEWSAERVNQARTEIATFTKRVFPTETLDAVKADPTDTGFSNAPWLLVLRQSSRVTSTCSRSGVFGGSR